MMNGRMIARDPLRLKRRSRNRAGYLYIAVLFTTLILVTVVATTIKISTLRTKSEVTPALRQATLRAAESEVHRLAVHMRTDTTWRTTNTNNVFSTWRRSSNVSIFGGFDVRHRYIDLDGDLTDDTTDAVELQVQAKTSETDVAISVQLVWDPQPLAFLSNSVTTVDDLEVFNGAMVTCGSTAQISDDFQTFSSGILTTPVAMIGGSTSATVRGDTSTSDQVTVLNLVDRYAPTAVTMNTASMPVVGGVLQLEDLVISPNSNPYGSASPSGVYLINANNGPIRIANCRIAATIVIQQASAIEISEGIVWEYPTTPDAILVTTAPVTISNVESVLDENLRSTNFNPAHTPYRVDQSNTTNDDVFPQTFRGWIHSIQDVSVTQSNDVPVEVVGGIYASDLEVEGRLRIKTLPGLTTDTPLNLLARGPMRFNQGTWRRIETP